MFYFLRSIKKSSAWSGAAALMVVALVLAASSLVQAQVLYGSLTGNVVDNNGAVVSGAKVEATNLGTSEVKTAVADERGGYTISNLLPGEYKVVISNTGFKTTINEKLAIVVNAVARFDARLEVGDVAATVNVSDDSMATLQTDRGDVNVVQTERQVNELPIGGSVGRNYQSLMQIVPGSVTAGEQNSAAGNPQRSISFNVNGTSRLQNNTRLEGSGIQYPWLPTNTVYVPPAEAIQEVSVVTNSPDPEQGFAAGAAINVILKSGSQNFHGAGWIYYTGADFRARTYFQPASQPQNPKDINVQYGYLFSGPIYKKKLFFFTDLERSTRRNVGNPTTLTIAPAVLRPTAAGVDFSSTGTIIYDPASNPDPRLRTPFPGNIIPFNRIDVAARELIARLPATTGAGFTNNYAAVGVGKFDRNNIDSKITFLPNEKLNMSGRYSLSPTNIFDPSALGEAGGDALNGGQVGKATGFIQVAGIGGTYTFTPNIVLDGNIGFTYQRLGAENTDIDTNFGLTVLQIPGTNGPDRLQGGIPSFQVTNWANMGNPNTGNPFKFRDEQYVGTLNLSWLKGAHGLRFGFDYQKQHLNHFQPQGGTFQTVRGTFQFSGNVTAQQACNAGTAPTVCAQPGTSTTPAAANRFNSWADFLLGLPTNAGKVDQLRNPNAVYMLTYAAYARDHWQATRDLTVTFGVRWELFPWPSRDNGIGVSRFDPSDGNVYTGGFSGVPRDTGADVGSGQFLPRLGLAYRWGDKTVIRVGYGHSSDPKPYIDFRNAYPVNFAWAQPSATFNGATNNFLPTTTLRIGLQTALYGTPPNINQGIIRLPATVGTTTFPKEPTRGIIQSFNLIVQRELPWKFVGSIGYVGTRIEGQMGFLNINAAPPGTGDAGRPLNILFGIRSDLNSIAPVGDAQYDSMQVELNRRYAGSIVGLTYTWSKAINYQDNDGNPRIPYRPALRWNRGLAGYDRTHNLQLYTVYDLPFGKGQRWAKSGIWSKLFEGIQINGIGAIMSGTPFSIIQNTAPNLLAPGSGQVPNQTGPAAILGGIGVGNPYFDRSVFVAENGARFGTVGRNTLRGPGFVNFDAGIFKTISFNEFLKVQLRAEVFNLFNHANFANPQGNLNDANFGYITGTTGQASRQWRFAAKMFF